MQSTRAFSLGLLSLGAILLSLVFFVAGRATAPRTPPVSVRADASLQRIASPRSVASATPTLTAVVASRLALIPPRRPRRVTVTGVSVNNSSAKIDFQPVPGAKDYRVLDLANPTLVKYAGLKPYSPDPYAPAAFAMQPDGVTPVWPLKVIWPGGGGGPHGIVIPNPEIEWNSLNDDKPHTFVVQAVDQLGPVPGMNQYDDNNNPRQPMPATPGMAMTLGANAGPTADGHISINGQGDPTNNPHVIAQSAPFVVQADPSVQPLPSRPDAAQTFLDTFQNSEGATIKQLPRGHDVNAAAYTMNAGTSKAWTIQYLNDDTIHSKPFVMDNHFMDVLFDGATPGTSGCCHVSHGVVSLSPDQTADISGGRILHTTMEVDGQTDARRWVAFNLAPAGDPLSIFDSTAALNQSDHAFFVEPEGSTVKTTLFTGPQSATDSHPAGNNLTGAAGQARTFVCRCYPLGGNGHGLDNRVRLDLFVSKTHFAYWEDGQLVVEGDIPGGLPFEQIKVYFSHYLYHSALEAQESGGGAPWNRDWSTLLPYSDERHWDNMGFEVLPAAAMPAGSWSALAPLIKMPLRTVPRHV